MQVCVVCLHITSEFIKPLHLTFKITICEPQVDYSTLTNIAETLVGNIEILKMHPFLQGMYVFMHDCNKHF